MIFSRQDIEQYCEENNLSFVVDSTNLSVDYNRNLVRHKIIPIFSKINPNFISTINRCCDIILCDELYLSKITEEALRKISYVDGLYLIEKFNLYDFNLKNRIIRMILKYNQLPYN